MARHLGSHTRSVPCAQALTYFRGDRAIFEGCRPLRGFRQDGGQPADTEGCYFQRVETNRAKMQAVKVAVCRTKDGLILATCRGPVPSGACQATGQRILKTGRSCSGDSLFPSAGWKLSFVIVDAQRNKNESPGVARAAYRHGRTLEASSTPASASAGPPFRRCGNGAQELQTSAPFSVMRWLLKKHCQSSQ